MTKIVGDENSFWFRVRDGVVEQGPQSPGSERMGPYSTRQEAEQALQTAKKRTESWDEEDRRDDE